jgi:hypothetical protein
MAHPNKPTSGGMWLASSAPGHGPAADHPDSRGQAGRRGGRPAAVEILRSPRARAAVLSLA